MEAHGGKEFENKETKQVWDVHGNMLPPYVNWNFNWFIMYESQYF